MNSKLMDNRMTTITVWERLNKGVGETGRFEHNHISYGFDPQAKRPIGLTKEQDESSRKGIWRSVEARLIDNVVHEIGPKDDGEFKVVRIDLPDDSGDVIRGKR